MLAKETKVHCVVTEVIIPNGSNFTTIYYCFGVHAQYLIDILEEQYNVVVSLETVQFEFKKQIDEGAIFIGYYEWSEDEESE